VYTSCKHTLHSYTHTADHAPPTHKALALNHAHTWRCEEWHAASDALHSLKERFCPRARAWRLVHVRVEVVEEKVHSPPRFYDAFRTLLWRFYDAFRTLFPSFCPYILMWCVSRLYLDKMWISWRTWCVPWCLFVCLCVCLRLCVCLCVLVFTPCLSLSSLSTCAPGFCLHERAQGEEEEHLAHAEQLEVFASLAIIGSDVFAGASSIKNKNYF
jgi:hypothetical protein